MQAGAANDSNGAVASSSLSAFPNEVFEAIFDHLSPLELSRIAQTSRALYAISTSSSLWERAYLSFWREGDEEQEIKRGTRAWRERRRLGELKEGARRAWRANDTVARPGLSSSKRQRRDGEAVERDESATRGPTPFPPALSSGGPSSSPNQSPHFYKLFLERIRIDEEVLKVVQTQCCSSSGWMQRVKVVAEMHGNDAKDVLHALVTSQQRKDGQDDTFASLDYTTASSIGFVFPTALQVRLPKTKRSRTHHLSLIHFGREMLEHLQCREALQGLLSLRPGSNVPPQTTHWTGMRSVGSDEAEYKTSMHAMRSKGFETAISWLSMFRGGEGQEIAEELDVLAVSCALYLASHCITLEQDAQQYATGIYRFMVSRSFRGATPTEYKNLDNNFIHMCLDESGRETLPMSLVIIYCAIASRLGLPALPTNTPARIIAVIEWPPPGPSPASEPSASSDRFWIDVYGDGQILNSETVCAMLARMRYPMNESFVAPSTPIATCLRASRNIVMSVQGAQSTPRFQAAPVAKLDAEDREFELMHESQDVLDSADEVFERLFTSPSALFHPRRTYLGALGPQLVSPFWPSSLQSHARYQRVSKWSDFDQQSAMHAASNALTRLGDELGDRGSDWCATLIQTYFPLDTLIMQGEFVEPSQQSPLYVQNEATRRSLSSMFQTLVQQDQEGPSVMRRTEGQDANILKVGTLFVHQTYGYKAAIVGWNAKCDATEEWILSMGVDGLPNGGRMQPFYQCLVEDGSTRYVAHCNIVPASRAATNGRGHAVSSLDAEGVLRQRGIGKFFRCLSLDGNHWRLVKNEQGQQAFPDD